MNAPKTPPTPVNSPPEEKPVEQPKPDTRKIKAKVIWEDPRHGFALLVEEGKENSISSYRLIPIPAVGDKKSLEVSASDWNKLESPKDVSARLKKAIPTADELTISLWTAGYTGEIPDSAVNALAATRAGRILGARTILNAFRD